LQDRVSANENSSAHVALLNFGDLTPCLTYGPSEHWEYMYLVWLGTKKLEYILKQTSDLKGSKSRQLFSRLSVRFGCAEEAGGQSGGSSQEGMRWSPSLDQVKTTFKKMLRSRTVVSLISYISQTFKSIWEN
jgi:hypothetical protein